MTVIVLLGPPGSGKGTQARLLSRATGLPLVSTGDMIRETIRRNGLESAKLQKFIVEGVLVPDEILIPQLTFGLRQHLSASGGVILDGAPRDVSQAQSIGQLLQGRENARLRAIFLDISQDEITKRIAKRRICVNCQAPSGFPGSPPSCEYCGGPLIKRQDDSVNALRNRLEEYEVHTRPLISFYEKQGALVRIDASTSIHIVFAEIVSKLGGL